MTLLGNVTSLLTLPLELRELVYKEVILAPTRSFALLQTCRKIEAEARKFLYHRLLVFYSQDSLYNWSASTSPENCSQVTTISVFIHDVDLRALLWKDLGPGMTASQPPLLTFELYKAELAKLHGAFEKLPKVTNLTLRVLPTRQSFLYRQFLSRVLTVLSSMYPMLVKLTIEGNMIHQNLDFLTEFTHLRHFIFDGVSASSAVATVETLNRLKNLQSLSLTSHQTLSTYFGLPHNASYCSRTPESDHFTRTMNHHRLFSPAEHLQDSSPELISTAEVLTALRNHKTLREITIYYWQEPHPRIFEALQEVVSNPGITTLELNWPNLRCEVLRLFSLIDHIETLQIKPKAPTDAVDIMCYIWTRRNEGDVARLRRLILTRPFEHWVDCQGTTSNRKDSGAGVTRGLNNCNVSFGFS
ncbi:hypothetical protein J1614_005890 [Plenodomus biglobosus]|nr:hypothetical protein J1614_005890 [Plenodomus biglobosus]